MHKTVALFANASQYFGTVSLTDYLEATNGLVETSGNVLSVSFQQIFFSNVCDLIEK